MESKYCYNYINCRNAIKGYGHNGNPKFNGRVCDDCNKEVVKHRMFLLERYG